MNVLSQHLVVKLPNRHIYMFTHDNMYLMFYVTCTDVANLLIHQFVNTTLCVEWVNETTQMGQKTLQINSKML